MSLLLTSELDMPLSPPPSSPAGRRSERRPNKSAAVLLSSPSMSTATMSNTTLTATSTSMSMSMSMLMNEAAASPPPSSPVLASTQAPRSGKSTRVLTFEPKLKKKRKSKKLPPLVTLTTMTSPNFDPSRLTERQQIALIERRAALGSHADDKGATKFLSPFVLDQIGDTYHAPWMRTEESETQQCEKPKKPTVPREKRSKLKHVTCVEQGQVTLDEPVSRRQYDKDEEDVAQWLLLQPTALASSLTLISPTSPVPKALSEPSMTVENVSSPIQQPLPEPAPSPSPLSLPSSSPSHESRPSKEPTIRHAPFVRLSSTSSSLRPSFSISMTTVCSSRAPLASPTASLHLSFTDMYQKSMERIHSNELNRWHATLQDALSRRSHVRSQCCRATLHLLRDYLTTSIKERGTWRPGTECKHVQMAEMKSLAELLQRQKRELEMLACH